MLCQCAGVADDMLDFLQEFFDAHPEVATNEVYVTGESYAGHYVPAVSHRIWEYNKAPFGMPINFKGLAIGATSQLANALEHMCNDMCSGCALCPQRSTPIDFRVLW